MLRLDCPLQLSPVFKPKIWGRDNLSPVFEWPPRQSARALAHPQRTDPQAHQNALIGEVWITDDASRFLNGLLAGMPLAEASEKYGPELHGESWQHRRFPILAKYIFTTDWLSVQVHPDDDYARVHDPGNFGKCEMWYVIQADAEAEILAGVKEGVSKEALRSAFESGTSRQLLRGFRPQAGEAIFVPPGTVHALGPGLVLFEAEENSDLTYRLDDFGRVGLDGNPRPLHLDKGFDVMRLKLPTYRDLPRLEFREPYGLRRYVLASRFFAVEELTLQKAASFQASRERVEVLSLLAGEGRVESSPGWLAYRTGSTWLVPPGAEPYRLVPQQTTRLLKSYVPDLENDFRRPLAQRDVPADQIAKVVFE